MSPGVMVALIVIVASSIFAAARLVPARRRIVVVGGLIVAWLLVLTGAATYLSSHTFRISVDSLVAPVKAHIVYGRSAPALPLPPRSAFDFRYAETGAKYYSRTDPVAAMRFYQDLLGADLMATGESSGGSKAVATYRDARFEIAIVAAARGGSSINIDYLGPGTGFRQPTVTVPVDMTAANNDQRQVDAGHSPWQLDPEMVAMAFINGKLGPDTIPYEAMELEMNNGTHAIVSVSSGPYARIYVQRLVRQDASGIWSVVGYDSR